MVEAFGEATIAPLSRLMGSVPLGGGLAGRVLLRVVGVAWVVLKALATGVLATFAMTAGGRTDVDLGGHLDAIRPPHGLAARGCWLARTYVSTIVETHLAACVTGAIVSVFNADETSRGMFELIGSVMVAGFCTRMQTLVDRAWSAVIALLRRR